MGMMTHSWGRGGGEDWEAGTDTQILLILRVRQSASEKLGEHRKLRSVLW